MSASSINGSTEEFLQLIRVLKRIDVQLSFLGLIEDRLGGLVIRTNNQVIPSANEASNATTGLSRELSEFEDKLTKHVGFMLKNITTLEEHIKLIPPPKQIAGSMLSGLIDK